MTDDVLMRTTLTIEPDVAQRIRRRMKQKGLSLKRVVNDALRTDLAETDEARQLKFKMEPHPCRFKAGIDPDKLIRLADELEAEESANMAFRSDPGPLDTICRQSF